MKKSFLFLVLATCFNVAGFAQMYIKMLEPSNEWNVLCGGITTNGDDSQQTDKLKIMGDTTINDTIYLKLYAKIFYTLSDSSLQLKSLLREDTLQKKIFVRNPVNAASTEKVLYNFSLAPLDSVVISVDYYNHPNPIKVDSIGIQYFAGKNRRIFYLTSFYNLAGNWHPIKNQWIEGIGKVDEFGKIKGPIDNIENITNELLCFWNSNQMLYQNPQYSNCMVVHVGMDKLNFQEKYQMYPNPSKEMIVLKMTDFSSFSNSNLQIFDLQGKLQKEIEINNSQNQLNIDIQRLKPGMYFGKLISQDGDIGEFKFVKN